MIRRKRRLLTIGHSYVMPMSRRLPNEMAKAGGSDWDVVTVGPSYYHGSPRHGDLAPATLIVEPGEAARTAGMPMFFTKNVHFALWGGAAMRLLSEDFDLVHCWQEPFNPLCAQVARATPAQSAFVFSTYQNISKRYPPPFDRIERYSLARSDAWIAGGFLVKNVLTQRAVYREKEHRVLGLGVDTEQFRPDAQYRSEVRASLGWNDGDESVIVGYLGRFTESKGLRVLMRSLERIDGPWRALFMGSGELEDEIVQWGKRFPDRVKICRNLSHDEVARHLNALDVLCAPSQTTPMWREQFGRMLVEAFACAVPVVTSDSGEIPYVVADAAVVVGERDDAGWVSALARMIADPAHRSHVGQLGLQRVRSTFAWSVLARESLDFFGSIIERRGTRRPVG